jgi:2-oxoisovalerate dehydrogenase E1 component
VPGLKIVYPSNPFDAKGLLLEAVEDPNPVLFFEHKKLYRSLEGEISSGYYTTEIGKASIVLEGTELTIISYGACIPELIELGKKFPGQIHLVDLRTLLPWDKETVKEAVEETGKVLLVTEDSISGSIMSDISSWIGENCFETLDGPVKRIGSLDTPIPFAENLEKNYLPFSKLESTIRQMIEY